MATRRSRIRMSRWQRRKVGSDGDELLIGAGCLREAAALTELFERQASLDRGVAKDGNAVLALGIARKDRRRIWPIIH